MVFRVFISIFLLFTTKSKKGHMDEDELRHCYGNFFESVVLKAAGLELCSKFCLNICTRLIDDSILKDTLQFKILRKWINVCAKVHENHDQTKIDEGAWKILSYMKT